MYKNNNINELPLVSIITPAYNCENYIKKTIDSVKLQTYKNWEMLIVDDVSTDSTKEIVQEEEKLDSRIKYFLLKEKGGASIARNLAIKKAKGKYVAFLDSDDTWSNTKLEKQIRFMEENHYTFSYHNYELIDEKGDKKNILRIAPSELTYFKQLLGCSIGCLTVVYNAENIGIVEIKKIDKRNDDALWIEVLRKCEKGYLLNENLAQYRISNSSLSSGSKIKMLKFHYQLYHQSQGFNFLKSFFFTLTNIIVYFYNKKRREIKL